MMIMQERVADIKSGIEGMECEAALEKIIAELGGERVAYGEIEELIQKAEADESMNVMMDSTLEGMAMNFSGLTTTSEITGWFLRYEIEVYNTDQGYYITELI